MNRALAGIERIALWTAHSKRCAYCGDPIHLRDLEVDHILPESLGNLPHKLARLKEELGLPLEFNLNSVRNFLPSHTYCNSRKSNRVFDPSRVRFFLEIAEGRLDAVSGLIPALELQASKESLLGAVQAAFESGDLDLAELVDAATKTEGFPLSTQIEFEDGYWDGRASSKQID